MIPFEASYSRLLTKLSESIILEKVQEKIINQAISEGFINDDTIAIDATHVESQLGISLTELRADVSQDPKWSVKKNSEGKNEFWFGYKGHLAVGTSSQYILQSLFLSGNLIDSKTAIPLLKGIETLYLSHLRFHKDAMNQFINRYIKWDINM